MKSTLKRNNIKIYSIHNEEKCVLLKFGQKKMLQLFDRSIKTSLHLEVRQYT